MFFQSIMDLMKEKNFSQKNFKLCKSPFWGRTKKIISLVGEFEVFSSWSFELWKLNKWQGKTKVSRSFVSSKNNHSLSSEENSSWMFAQSQARIYKLSCLPTLPPNKEGSNSSRVKKMTHRDFIHTFYLHQLKIFFILKPPKKWYYCALS